ncbi:MAG: hypothetical protein QM723_12920 [Myxococcaceae bacterium]
MTPGDVAAWSELGELEAHYFHLAGHVFVSAPLCQPIGVVSPVAPCPWVDSRVVPAGVSLDAAAKIMLAGQLAECIYTPTWARHCTLDDAHMTSVNAMAARVQRRGLRGDWVRRVERETRDLLIAPATRVAIEALVEQLSIDHELRRGGLCSATAARIVAVDPPLLAIKGTALGVRRTPAVRQRYSLVR